MNREQILAYLTANSERLLHDDPESIERLAWWIDDYYGLTDNLAEDLEDIEQRHLDAYMGTYESKGDFAQYIAHSIDEHVNIPDYVVVDWDSTFDTLCRYHYYPIERKRYTIDFYIA